VNSIQQRARHALGWLEQQPEFLDAARKAERLLQLQADLRESAQGLELTALGIEGEDLLVGTSGAGAAAKLRQLAPSITRALQARAGRLCESASGRNPRRSQPVRRDIARKRRFRTPHSTNCRLSATTQAPKH